MNSRRNAIAFAYAALAGVAVWLLASLTIPRREPWDAGIYWALFYPMAIVAAAYLAYRYPQHPGVIAIIVFEGQFLAMCVRNGELGNLWPIGMLLFAVVALPAVAVAGLAARRSPFLDE